VPQLRAFSAHVFINLSLVSDGHLKNGIYFFPFSEPRYHKYANFLETGGFLDKET
jgi:hypothetical protein